MHRAMTGHEGSPPGRLREYAFAGAFTSPGADYQAG